jgi:hypothetical protein
MNARHTKLSNQFWSGFTPDAREPFGGYFAPHLVSRIAGIVLPVEMCEESELSPLSAKQCRTEEVTFLLFPVSLMWGAIGQGDQISAR